MDSCGIHISPVYDGALAPVTLQDAFGPVHVWLLPFVKPAHVRRWFPDADIESYTDAMAEAVAHMDIDTAARNVLVTHQFVTGRHAQRLGGAVRRRDGQCRQRCLCAV